MDALVEEIDGLGAEAAEFAYRAAAAIATQLLQGGEQAAGTPETARGAAGAAEDGDLSDYAEYFSSAGGGALWGAQLEALASALASSGVGPPPPAVRRALSRMQTLGRALEAKRGGEGGGEGGGEHGGEASRAAASRAALLAAQLLRRPRTQQQLADVSVRLVRARAL